MAINQTTYSEAQVSGLFQSAQASIQMTPEMFALLSAGIYEDRILAVIRELSCNGRDAMVEQAQKLSIDVSALPLMQINVPTTFEPTFSIRDYGTGLSQDDIFNIFMCFGKSTKTSSNDLIGMFGIGSKSPLAYTDSYIITSYMGGEETQYNIYMDKGIPSVTKLFTKATEEMNGLKISIAVRGADCSAFFSRIQTFYKLFNFPVEFTGREVNCEADFAHQCENYWIIKNYNEGVYALMGGVPYAVPREIAQELRLVVNSNTVILPFEIGELAIAPSRENLSFVDGDATDQALKARIQNVVAKYVQDINNVLAPLDNWRQVFHMVTNNYRINLRTTLASRLEWKGVPITNFDSHYENRMQGWDVTKNTLVMHTQTPIRSGRSNGIMYAMRDYVKGYYVDVNQKFIVLEDDLVRGTKRLLASIISQERVKVIIRPCDEAVEFLKEFFGEDNLLFWKASEVRAAYQPVRSATPRNRIKVSGVWEYTKNGGTKPVEEMDEFETGLYVDLIRDNVVFENDDGTLKASMEQKYIRKMVDAGLYEKIFFIRKTANKKNRSKALTKLTFETIQDKLSKLISKKDRKQNRVRQVYYMTNQISSSYRHFSEIQNELMTLKDYPTLRFYHNSGAVKRIMDKTASHDLDYVFAQFNVNKKGDSTAQVDRIVKRYEQEMKDFREKYDFFLGACGVHSYVGDTGMKKIQKMALLIAKDEVSFDNTI